VLLFSGAAIARRARDYFGFLLASGIVIALALQAAINIAVVTGSAPTKGIPLPFITFGGSALVVTLAEVGLLLSVDRRAAAALEEPGTESAPATARAGLPLLGAEA
jgi:cell division protein FtsW